MTVDGAFVWAAGGSAAIYALTLVALVWSRVRFDRRRADVARLTGIVTGEAGASLDPRARAAWAAAALAAMPRRRVERIASETALPREVDEVVCRHLLERLGLERVRRNAAASRGERGRWSRIAALRVLAFGRPDDVWEVIERALVDSDREVVAAAVAMLGNLRDLRAAELLVKALRVGCYPASRIAAFLDRSPLDLAPLISPLLRHPGAIQRYWGATLMRRYPGAVGLVDELARLTHDEEPLVRRAAVASLAAIGGEAAHTAARALVADDVWFVRAHAARALGTLGDAGDAPLVASLLADREWWVRYAAKVGLEAMGPGVEPTLLPMLDASDRFAKNGAAEVLQNLGAFERWLGEATALPEETPPPDRLRRLADAGGWRMSDAAVERLAPDARARATRLLASLGIELTGSPRPAPDSASGIAAAPESATVPPPALALAPAPPPHRPQAGETTTQEPGGGAA